jgi:hypothetical protein
MKWKGQFADGTCGIGPSMGCERIPKGCFNLVTKKQQITRHAALGAAFVAVYLGLCLPQVTYITQIGFTAWYPAIGYGGGAAGGCQPMVRSGGGGSGLAGERADLPPAFLVVFGVRRRNRVRELLCAGGGSFA